MRFVGILIAIAVLVVPAYARWSEEALSRLSDNERGMLAEWETAQAAHRRVADGYWKKISIKRVERQRKRRADARLTAADYVVEGPPAYAGPPAPSAILKKLPAPPAGPPPRELPVVADFIAQAETHYRFRPHRVAEDDFMRAYAKEALRLGLSGEQIVRVYAFETGGMGTHDMQSGFGHGVKKKRAVSSAIGYAQLLAANSIGELAENGGDYLARLDAMATMASGERRTELAAKVTALRAMIKTAKALPGSWGAHVRFATSTRGQAIHAVNLDGDIGPWVQVRKLLGLKRYGEKAGLSRLSGAQMETLNLAGPGRGLEMLDPSAKDAATANFFERTAYARNPVVHGKTAGSLVAEIDAIMSRNLTRDGSRRFLAAFREIAPAAASSN